MSTDLTHRKNTYPGDGTANPRVTTFPVFDKAELVLELRDDSDESTDLWAEGLDYSVVVATPLPGFATITPLAVIPAGFTLIVYRVTPDTQAHDYSTGDAFPPDQVEIALDRASHRDQELREELTRAVRAPIEDDVAPAMVLPIKSQRALKYLFCDVDGNISAVENVDLTGTVVGAAGLVLLPLASFDDWRNALSAIRQVLCDSLGFGNLGLRPAAAAFQGLWFDAENGRFYGDQSSVAWFELGVAQFATGSLPAPAVATAGRLMVDNTRLELLRDTGVVRQVIRGPLPRGHIAGLQLTRPTVNTVGIGVGQCRVGTSADRDQNNCLATTAFTKALNAVWAAGTGNGGRAAGVPHAAATGYFVFALGKANDLSFDYGFDTSVDAVALLLDANVAAAGYTLFRRIGWVKTAPASTDIVDFVQAGDDFRWKVPPAVESSPLANQSGADKTLAITNAPLGFSKRVNLRIELEAAAGVTTLMTVCGSHESIGGTPTVLGGGVPQVLVQLRRESGDFIDMHDNLDLLLDSTNTIKFRASVANNSRLHTQVNGWNDPRGRDL